MMRHCRVVLGVLVAFALFVVQVEPFGEAPSAVAAGRGNNAAGPKGSITLPGLAPAGGWCRYPNAKPKPAAAVVLIPVGEVEPNDTPVTAQPIPLGDGVGQDRDIDIAGSIAPATDTDYYGFNALKGDVIGMAALGGGPLDTILAVTDLAGGNIITNDDHGGIASIYPPGSPFPGGVDNLDSALTWVVPTTGDYLIRVTSFNASSSGSYTLQIRSRRPAFESQCLPEQQTIFLDFDGASINAIPLFGGGNNPANLSPLSSFLAGWGLAPADESPLIDEIIAVVRENFDDLRIPGLNGDRDTDSIDGHFDVAFLNSRDDADPFGASNVSRVIIGGTIDELGIPTIGIAESIDPGNFGTEETAVVLLDLLSAAAGDPNSINTIPVDPSCTKIQAVGRVVGNIVAHEAGHYLGNWHTDSQNAVRCLMDEGGCCLDTNMGGVGPDGTMCTADDEDPDFIGDTYSLIELVAVGQERTDVRTAFALATATQLNGCKDVKFSQLPTDNEEDIASNIDWTDGAPNVVVADDFRSDGRPITGVRWWGSKPTTVVTKACDTPGTCAAGFVNCGGDPNCFCFSRPDGTGNCAPALSCGGLVLCPNGDSDCPAGTKCFVDTCCVDPVCSFNCGEEPSDCSPANGGFETGDFSGWTATTNGLGEFFPWTIGPAGTTTGFHSSSPLSGTFDALNGFDGEAGLVYELFQDVSLPAGAAIMLTTNHRIQYDSLGIRSNLPRELDITIRNTGNVVLASLFHQDVVINGAPNTDLGWNNQVFDISAFAGQTVRIHFGEFIPENFTGPGMIEFDDISVSCTPVSGGEQFETSNGLTMTGRQVISLGPPPPVTRLSFEELRAKYQVIRDRVLSAGGEVKTAAAPSRVVNRNQGRRYSDSKRQNNSSDNQDPALELGPCGPGNGDCCINNGTPGCDDATCCNLICGADPFCCTDVWDDICRDEALANCDPALCPPPPPPNDDCLNAVGPLAVPSTTPGTTAGATMDSGFPDCGTAAITSPGVWFTVMGTGNTMTASLCNAATTFDSKLSVYCPDCATATCVDGNDDFCGLQSQVSWCSQAGQSYLILVHGFGGASGPFELDVSDDGTPCPNPPSCVPPPPCGDPGAGDCCIANGTPNCDDATCCELVCAADPFCCETEWDDFCAGEARDLCDRCGATPDGWLISFHEPLDPVDLNPREPLGLYFCPPEAVVDVDTGIPACDGALVRKYSVQLDDCCLIHSDVDSRSGNVPAQPHVFREQQGFRYDIDIQAEVGHRYEMDADGLCIEPAIVTGNVATSDFWGWHSTAIENGARPALSSTVTMAPGAPGVWLYGPWNSIDPTCGNPNMAFELLTTGCASNDDCDDGDECTQDVCVEGTCIFTPLDGDGDGVPDCTDNCVCTPNPSQCDSDGDGFGNHCDADLNNDGVVGIPDFGLFRACFGSIIGDPNYDPACDLNCDGAVGIPDFTIFRRGFGLPPGSDCIPDASQSQRPLPAGIGLKDLRRGLENKGRTNR